jgi:prepilin-type N-terminal cleavage/methylation domain-containing protein
MFAKVRGRPREQGFTLAEVLVAVAVLAIGLIAIGAGFQQATSGVATGRGETTAVFLAEQRVEQLKAQAITNFSAVSLNAGTTTDYCAGAGTCQGSPISGPSYTRATTITDVASAAVAGCPVTPLSCKEVRVRVTYRPVTSSGDLSMQRTVDVFTTLGPRS